ncbi:MBL fold metallo-hydrolase [Candidatus Woesearchaeota archaeon]|nr:MBL fold metallo-hydrolase [Candidatus Woesearchaeota archaeon]
MVKITILHKELQKFDNDLSGVSFLIEIKPLRILFDVSFKDEILKNAKQGNIDLKNIDFLVISHGHIDHTEGLKYIDFSEIKNLICHPLCLEKKYYEGEGEIGSPLSAEELRKRTNLILSKEPYWINKKIVFLGQIPRKLEFEGKQAVGYLENKKEDFVIDDSAVAIKHNKGVIIISGCSHSGICNIVNYAKKVCNEEKVYSVIGGFHLFNKEQTDKTIDFFKKQNIEKLFPLHCLDEYAFSEFSKIGGIRLKTLDTFEL